MSLNTIGSERCASCGKALDLEAELTPTQLLCPRGCGPLSASIPGVTECERCGGLFVEAEPLTRMVSEHRPKDRARPPKTSIRRPELPAEAEVRYLPCPSCNVRMNRAVFGKSSGVVVDVCKMHGTWFDARELTASLAFVEMGGIELVEKREKLRAEEARRQAEIDRRTSAFDALNSPIAPPIQRIFEGGTPDRLEVVSELLEILLGL